MGPRVQCRPTAPQTLPIPADSGVIELNIQPLIHSVFPVVIQISRNAVAVVNGSKLGKNMSATMRLKSESELVGLCNRLHHRERHHHDVPCSGLERALPCPRSASSLL